jgi:hypothetical protein
MQLPKPEEKTPQHKAANLAVRQLDAGRVRSLCLLGDPDDVCAPFVAFHLVKSMVPGNPYGGPWCDMDRPHLGIGDDEKQMECVEKAPVVVFYQAHGYVDIIALEDFVTLVLSRHARKLQTIITTRHRTFADVCNWLVESGLTHARVAPLFDLFTAPEAVAVSIQETARMPDAPPAALPAHAYGPAPLRLGGD